MSDIGKLVYFYTLTTPMGNGLGCFRVGMAAMTEESRLSTKRFDEGFGAGLVKKLFKYDAHHRVLLIPKYFERNPPSNPNGITAMSKEYLKIPDCELKIECFQIVSDWVQTKGEGFKERFAELFKKPCLNGSGNHLGLVPPSDSPSVPNSDPPIPPKGFDEFWEAYPKRKGKQAALRAWKKAIKIADADTLIEAVKKQCFWEQWTRDNGQFIPNPATWLNQGCWEDEITEPQQRRLQVEKPKVDLF